MKATFFWTSVMAVVPVEPFVLRELRPADSDVFVDDSAAFSSGPLGKCTIFGGESVIVDRDSEIGGGTEGSPTDGRGRDDICEAI